MSLHGNLQVNGIQIGVWWSAQRIEGEHGPCRYACRVYDQGHMAVFEIDHLYEDGALVLAAKVLTRAVEELT